MTAPLVTVVIPCYHGRKYLAEAVGSCLRQTHPRVEVIVVDDCSPDRDYELAEELARNDPRVKVIRRAENGGIGRALNTGYAAATGEYFARLAQDDVFREDALARLLTTLQARPDAGLAYADMRLIDADGKDVQLMPTVPDPAHALLPANRVGLCVLWPRAVWEAVGPFDPRYDLCDDYEFFLRISRRFPLVKAEGEAPFFFRYHPVQGSVTKERAHDIVRCRVHLAHWRAELRRGWLRPGIWKRLVGAWVRLIACRTGLYQYWKYDGRTLAGERKR